jgi:hypothetical protein
MKRANSQKKSARSRRSSKRVRPASTQPAPSRPRAGVNPKPLSPVRAVRTAYLNAFCAFLHSPAQ